MTSNLSIIPAIEQLTTRVIRILGCNPGPFTLQGTNTYLIGTGKSRILLDTGESGNENYISNLAKVLNENSINVDQLIITHWHGDHLGGVTDIYNKFFKNNDTLKYVNKMKRKSKVDAPLENQAYNFVEDGHKFSSEGVTLKAFYTPGHTDDHMALLLEEENAMFTGDCVLGEGTCVFEDLTSYMKSLDILKKINPNVIYPGHGAVVRNPAAHIQAYIDNRNMRETQVINILEETGEEFLTAMDIVKKAYVGISERLYPAAANNVKLHLIKLLDEDKVEFKSSGINEFWRWKNVSKY